MLGGGAQGGGRECVEGVGPALSLVGSIGQGTGGETRGGREEGGGGGGEKNGEGGEGGGG